MELSDYTFSIAQADLVENERGKKDLIVSMVSCYKDGKFVKHCKLNEELLEAMQEKQEIYFDLKRLRK